MTDPDQSRLPGELRAFLPHLSGARGQVLLALLLRADASGQAWPSLATIMADSGIRRRNTVSRALRDLEGLRADGRRLLDVDRRRQHGRFTVNRYWLFPTGAELEAGPDMEPGPERASGEPPPTEPARVSRLERFLQAGKVELNGHQRALVLRLGDEGIDDLATRVRLVETHDPADIARQILWIDRRVYRDRGAMLAAAIRGSWDPPLTHSSTRVDRVWEWDNAILITNVFSYEEFTDCAPTE